MKRKQDQIESSTKKPKTGVFKGTKVFFAASSIPFSGIRIRQWTSALEQEGGAIAQSQKDKHITHTVIGELPHKLGKLRGSPVSTAWLVDSLAQRESLSVSRYIVAVDNRPEAGLSSDAEVQDLSRSKKLRRFERWLGHWRAEYDDFRDVLDVVLQAKFGDGLPENQHIAKALSELGKYEGALAADYNSSGKESLGGDSFNRRTLTYAKAAAAVKACAFPITKDLKEGQIPFVGEGTISRILDIVKSGTTDDIEAHRNGWELRDSHGNAREAAGGTKVRGGAAKLLFTKLPGVGPATAQAWYDLGLRTLEDVEAAAKKGGKLGPDTALRLTYEQSFSLENRADLLAECSTSDIKEMQDEVLMLLSSMAGTGWIMTVVGGARRGKASHDVDIVVAHPDKSKQGLVRLLADKLIARGRLVPSSQGFCHIQDGRIDKEEFDLAKANNIAADRFDRLLGVFITQVGHMRRMDLIFVPWEQRAFALLGWSGSQQYLRFLRSHADHCGMRLNSHSLRVWQGKGDKRTYMVPSEGPPQNRDQRPYWPPGWTRQRRVETEADIFELLGLPYREPHERKA